MRRPRLGIAGIDLDEEPRFPAREGTVAAAEIISAACCGGLGAADCRGDRGAPGGSLRFAFTAVLADA
jgi:hypothetical protein